MVGWIKKYIKNIWMVRRIKKNEKIDGWLKK